MSNAQTSVRFFECWAADDADGLLSLCADDVVAVDNPTGQRFEGRDAFGQFYRYWRDVASTQSITGMTVHEAGDVVVLEFTASGVHDGVFAGVAGTGAALQVAFCCVHRYGPDGKLREHCAYYDQLTLVAQIANSALPSLTPEEALRAAAGGRAVSYAAGETVFRSGDEADRFYIVTRGTAEVLVSDDGPAIDLTAGQFFGEIGLLNAAPRMATVRAKTDLEVLAIDRDQFEAMVGSSAPTATLLNEVIRTRLQAA